MHGPRRLRARPVLHAYVEPPGAPTSRGRRRRDAAARAADPLSARAARRLCPRAAASHRGRRTALRRRALSRTRSRPPGPRATRGAQALRRRAPRPDCPGPRATTSCRCVSRAARGRRRRRPSPAPRARRAATARAAPRDGRTGGPRAARMPRSPAARPRGPTVYGRETPGATQPWWAATRCRTRSRWGTSGPRMRSASTSEPNS